MDIEKLNNVIGATNTQLLEVGRIIGKRDTLDHLINIVNDCEYPEDLELAILDWLEEEGYNVR